MPRQFEARDGNGNKYTVVETVSPTDVRPGVLRTTTGIYVNFDSETGDLYLADDEETTLTTDDPRFQKKQK